MLPDRFVVRPPGWTVPSRETHDLFRQVEKDHGEQWADAFTEARDPEVIWRGMTSAEYDATIGAGKPIQSTGTYSFSFEGTNFANGPGSAEGYVNFGRDDPTATGKPTYLVAVEGSVAKRARDGYYKTQDPVALDKVLGVWEMRPEPEGVVAHRVESDLHANPKLVGIDPLVQAVAGLLVPNRPPSRQQVELSVADAPRLMSELGAETFEDLHQVGAGTYARAFLTPSGDVLKLTTDADDAAVARMVQEAGQVTGLVNVHAVYRMRKGMETGAGRTVPLYAIVSEMVIPLSKIDELEPGAAMYEPAEELSKAADSLAMATAYGDEFHQEGELLSSAMLSADDYEIGALGMQYLHDLVKGWYWMYKRGFVMRDLHHGNVGLSGEGAVILDLGMSGSASSERPEIGLAANPRHHTRPVHRRVRDLVPNATSLSPRDRDELLRRVRELDALEERALEAYERQDYALAERIDSEYAERADELEGLAAEVMDDLSAEDAEPGEWDTGPMGSITVGPEGNVDLLSELADLYHEYLHERDNPLSRFHDPSSVSTFSPTPFPVNTHEDALAYFALSTIEDVTGRRVGVVDRDQLVAAARDAYERKRQLIGLYRSKRTDMTPNPSPGIDSVFDEAFDRIEDTFPDMGSVEFWEDDAAGSDNGAGADRQFAYCKDGNPISIAFAPKATQLDRTQLVGLMRHEFGHALEYRYGVSELERRLKVKLPDKVERRADAIAEAVWGEPIAYDERLIQCVKANGVRPRPAHLPDEQAVLRANPSSRAKRCTQLTLQAFGIDDPEWTERCVATGLDVLQILKENGWSYRPVYVEGEPTVTRFMSDHPRGKFVLGSRGHSMAVLDGELWDLSGGSKRHRVLSASEVWKPGDEPVYEPFSTYRPTKGVVANPATASGGVTVGEWEGTIIFDWRPAGAPLDYEGISPDEDGIGGYLLAALEEFEEFPHRRLVVEYVEVDPRYRRQGVATRLYQAALDYARSEGACLMSDSRRTEASNEFWRKMEQLGYAEMRGEGEQRTWDGRFLDYSVTYYLMKDTAPAVLPNP